MRNSKTLKIITVIFHIIFYSVLFLCILPYIIIGALLKWTGTYIPFSRPIIQFIFTTQALVAVLFVTIAVLIVLFNPEAGNSKESETFFLVSCLQIMFSCLLAIGHKWGFFPEWVYPKGFIRQ